MLPSTLSPKICFGLRLFLLLWVFTFKIFLIGSSLFVCCKCSPPSKLRLHNKFHRRFYFMLFSYPLIFYIMLAGDTFNPPDTLHFHCSYLTFITTTESQIFTSIVSIGASFSQAIMFVCPSPVYTTFIPTELDFHWFSAPRDQTWLPQILREKSSTASVVYVHYLFSATIFGYQEEAPTLLQILLIIITNVFHLSRKNVGTLWNLILSTCNIANTLI